MNTPLQMLAPYTEDLGGGFTVRRLLPAAARQAVGPIHPAARKAPGAGRPVRLFQSKFQRSAARWPTRSVQSKPFTTTAFMPRVTAPSTRASAR